MSVKSVGMFIDKDIYWKLQSVSETQHSPDNKVCVIHNVTTIMC